MINSIFDVVNELRTVILPLGIPVYKFIRPTTNDGECIVIDYMPIRKNSVNSVNDLVLFIYVKKIGGEADSKRIQTVCDAINGYVETFDAQKGVIYFNNELEPFTNSFDISRTVTQLRFRTINS